MAMKKQPMICEICGKEYMGIKLSKTCSEECRKEQDRIKNAIWKAEHRTKSKRKKGMSELARINQEARENGMTYGKYVAFCESQKQQKRLGRNVNV